MNTIHGRTEGYRVALPKYEQVRQKGRGGPCICTFALCEDPQPLIRKTVPPAGQIRDAIMSGYNLLIDGEIVPALFSGKKHEA